MRLTKLPAIFGLNGTKLTEEEKELFKQNTPIGFILFSRNIESKSQLLNLTQEIRENFGSDILIFIDQEGGRVQRIAPPVGIKKYPNGEYFSNLYQKDPIEAKKEIYQNYLDLTSELKFFGIDSPCAPVSDLLYKDTTAAIGDRAFGLNVQQVVDLSTMAIKAILDNGLIAFLKHIPGHGMATVDSHYFTPIVKEKIEFLAKNDFKVFADLNKQIRHDNLWGMIAHIIYEDIDADNPATVSPKVINYIRENIGFTGKLITDDICMYGLHGKLGEKIAKLKLQNAEIDFDIKKDFCDSLYELTQRALHSGCDYILHCSGDINEISYIIKAIISYEKNKTN